jgi:hypothetical protein
MRPGQAASASAHTSARGRGSARRDVEPEKSESLSKGKVMRFWSD